MMELIGFLASVGFMVLASLAWFGAFCMWFGQYNIGGVPNTWKHRVAIAAALAVLLCLWVVLYLHMPFTIALKI